MKFWNPWIAAALAMVCVGIAPAAHADSTTRQAQAAPPQSEPDQDSDQPGRWMIRVRGYDFVPANHSAPFSYLGLYFEPHSLTVSQKFGVSADVSYNFHRSFAVELSVGAPLQSKVNLIGGSVLGSMSQSPASLTLQYHYQVPHQPANFYVGAGFDYSHVTSESLSAAGRPLGMTRNMYGVCYQLGVDIAIAQGFYLNLDFRHMQLSTNLREVKTGLLLTDANMTPNLYSIGIGHRF